ncbi:hypothetical protein Cni_G11309 [Canna indica]|uniref:Vacuolar protein 14 C-terminal Fig4-binding domain-containing protein n=1 Tax=Canna indica TaxID=4628 RepID=A0AAQ3K622_9LILI|nr:hypothetical protein Cni_G11309 [Canna indica]
MAEAWSFVPSSVLKLLPDKLYNKRKNAAIELEGIVELLGRRNEHEKISSVINMLTTQFIKNPQPIYRKGGLIGLAGVTIGLFADAPQYLEEIIPPIIGLFADEDSGVRFSACEAMYNVAKAVRGEFIIYFNPIFDALCKLSADSAPNVQSAAHVLDKLVKDIVVEGDKFSIEEFIPLLQERMNIINPYIRQFLLGWINVLDGAPDIDILGFLPDFLDGLFDMLSDSQHEIRHQGHYALSEFLEEIKNSPLVDFGRMAEILVRRAGSPDELTRLTFITWMNEFMKLGGEHLVPYYSDILQAILTCISDKEENIRAVARETNEGLRAIRADPDEGFNIRAVLSVASSELTNRWEATRVEALRWVSILLERHRNEVISFLHDNFGSFLSALADSSDEVVLLVIEVHACIAEDPERFNFLIDQLVQQFRNDHAFLAKRGALIFRRLSVLLNAERVYREFASKLECEAHFDFASIMIEVLNLTLLTSSELTKLRILLKQSLVESSAMDLFVSLYSSWCHSPLATISLCLLAQAYNHAISVIQSLEEEDITIAFLVQLDKLVQLLETPVFTFLRLQLTEPKKHMSLLKTLYGLLMLLPQEGPAFKILNSRLKNVPPYTFSNEEVQHQTDTLFSKTKEDVTKNKDAVLQHQTDTLFSKTKEDVTINKDAVNIFDTIDFPFRLQQFQQILHRHRLYSQSHNSGSSE